MSARIRRVLATLTLGVVSTACIFDPVAPEIQIDTLDAALNEVTLPALDYAAAVFSGVGVVTPTIVPSRCQFDGTSQVFVCGTLSGGGLTLNQNYTLLDGAGGKQAAYDMTTTSGLVVSSAVSGTAVGAGTSRSVDGEQQLTLSGLGTAQHTINGSSLTRTTITHTNGAEPPITSTITTKVVDLVVPLPLPGDPTPWPASGTIELQTNTDLGYVIPLDAGSTISSATLEFSGSAIVQLTITTPKGKEMCRIDITTTLLGC